VHEGVCSDLSRELERLYGAYVLEPSIHG
jgi:hypothetical protein